MRINLQSVLKLRPCARWDEDRLEKLFKGRKSVRVSEAVDKILRQRAGTPGTTQAWRHAYRFDDATWLLRQLNVEVPWNWATLKERGQQLREVARKADKVK